MANLVFLNKKVEQNINKRLMKIITLLYTKIYFNIG